jgi:hypothetical protein
MLNELIGQRQEQVMAKLVKVVFGFRTEIDHARLSISQIQQEGTRPFVQNANRNKKSTAREMLKPASGRKVRPA